MDFIITYEIKVWNAFESIQRICDDQRTLIEVDFVSLRLHVSRKCKISKISSGNKGR